jgi:hypothetical protein
MPSVRPELLDELLKDCQKAVEGSEDKNEGGGASALVGFYALKII